MSGIVLGSVLGRGGRVLAVWLRRGCRRRCFLLGRQELMNRSFYLGSEDVVQLGVDHLRNYSVHSCFQHPRPCGDKENILLFSAFETL